MKRLKKPNFDPSVVFAACVSGVADVSLTARLTSAAKDMVAIAEQYEIKAETHQLYSFRASEWGKGEQVVLGGLTKTELTDLYSSHMVGEDKPGRKYYDQLMMLAPLGKCPYCGFGHASTLDHFLSKARYPAFSVLASNLVPACTDCNKGKGSPVVSSSSQVLHPYFESEIVEKEAWLFAEAVESSPVTVKYSVMPPDTWPLDLQIRIRNFFSDFDLANRFAIEAASELVSICDLLALLGTSQLRKMHLSVTARVERQNRKNSWKAALYEGLLGSEWFCEHGYKCPPLPRLTP